MPWLVILPDGLWILSLSIMAGASLQAWKRIRPGARMPMGGYVGATGDFRLGYSAALAGPVIVILVFSLGLAVRHRLTPPDSDGYLLWTGLRITIAGLAPLLHLRWLGDAMRTLAAEGWLKS